MVTCWVSLLVNVTKAQLVSSRGGSKRRRGLRWSRTRDRRGMDCRGCFAACSTRCCPRRSACRGNVKAHRFHRIKERGRPARSRRASRPTTTVAGRDGQRLRAWTPALLIPQVIKLAEIELFDGHPSTRYRSDSSRVYE